MPMVMLSFGKQETVYRRASAESVEIYNREWPHLALKYKTPDAVHQAF